MSDEKKIIEIFEKFAQKYEESIFSLISSMNQISDNFYRVQDGLDYLGRISMQIKENKQLMGNVERSFKDLGLKLREIEKNNLFSDSMFESTNSNMTSPSRIQGNGDSRSLISSTSQDNYGFTPKPESQNINIEDYMQENLSDQRELHLTNPEDVWNNLIFTIKESQNCEQIAYSLALTNDNLRRYIKFHKILFEIITLASEYRQKGKNRILNNSEKTELIKKIENWKVELKI